jgi:hypothetical protein
MSKSPLSSSTLLVWSKAPRKKPQEYVLMDGANVVARLRWEKTGGSLALAESSEGRWSLKRTGFLSTKVSVRLADSDTEIASYYPNMFGGGRIEMTDGRSWRFISGGFLNPHYTLLDPADQQVLILKVKGFGTGGEIQFGSAPPDIKTAHFLSALTWYVTLLAKEDASVAAIIITSMVAIT